MSIFALNERLFLLAEWRRPDEKNECLHVSPLKTKVTLTEAIFLDVCDPSMNKL
jgi:hypothetical protein